MRSFLLLEDDYGVDWEVDQEPRTEVDHPHRAPLQGRAAVARRERRRPGQPAPHGHVCLSPLERSDPAHEPRRRRHAESRPRSARSGEPPALPGA
jgi:hypothetical protein